MLEKKVKAIVNGKTVMLSEAAFKIAKRFYNASSEEELRLAKPVELTRPLIKPTMKPIIIKPPMKEVPEPKVEGDPVTEVTVTAVTEDTGDPKPVKKAPAKRKKK